MWGLDLRNGTAVDRNKTGLYSTEIFTDEAVRKIREHADVARSKKDDDRLFLTINHQAPHTANLFRPYEVPDRYLDRVSHVHHHARRHHAALLASLDDAVGRVVQALDESEVI